MCSTPRLPGGRSGRGTSLAENGIAVADRLHRVVDAIAGTCGGLTCSSGARATAIPFPASGAGDAKRAGRPADGAWSTWPRPRSHGKACRRRPDPVGERHGLFRRAARRCERRFDDWSFAADTLVAMRVEPTSGSAEPSGRRAVLGPTRHQPRDEAVHPFKAGPLMLARRGARSATRLPGVQRVRIPDARAGNGITAARAPELHVSPPQVPAIASTTR
jgi:hypothetical protein